MAEMIVADKGEKVGNQRQRNTLHVSIDPDG